MNERVLTTLLKMQSGDRPKRVDVAYVVDLHNRNIISLTPKQISTILAYGWCEACIRFIRK